jgi:hypothetical protein
MPQQPASQQPQRRYSQGMMPPQVPSLPDFYWHNLPKQKKTVPNDPKLN